MLTLLLAIIVISAIAGLLFSSRGDEANATLRGAKNGFFIGCGCLVFLFVIAMAVLFLLGLGFIVI